MDRADSASRGKVLLATVKGDVHDIGKNLVDIILSINGFDVVNLGIEVSPEVRIQAVRDHNPDVVRPEPAGQRAGFRKVTAAAPAPSSTRGI